MTISPKVFLHTQEEHISTSDLLLNTNQGGHVQLLAFVILSDLETAATVCIEGRGTMHGLRSYGDIRTSMQGL